LNLFIENGTRYLKITMGFVNFACKGNRADKRAETQKNNMLVRYTLKIRFHIAFDLKVHIQTADT